MIRSISPFVFDLLIALVVGGIPTWVIVNRVRVSKHTARPIIGPLLALLALTWGVVVYGSFIAPKKLVVQEYQVTIAPTSSYALRVAVISDTHLGYYKHADWLAKVVERVNALEPDLVLLAGDYVSNPAGIEQLYPLQRLQSKYGTYAALGNWDYSIGAVDVRKEIERWNVEVLINESAPVVTAGGILRLVGADEYRYGESDWDTAMSETRDGKAVIALVHSPDHVEAADFHGVDLLIAGHTHGGQIRLPGIGAVPRIPIGIGQRFDKGVFDVGKTQMFITPGVGESGPRARLFQPPEISLLTVTF